MNEILHYCKISGIRKDPEYSYRLFNVLPKISGIRKDPEYLYRLFDVLPKQRTLQV